MHCKSYSHFFSKKFQHICVSLDVNFNESLTNDVVSFEQLGPEIYSTGADTNGLLTVIPHFLNNFLKTFVLLMKHRKCKVCLPFLSHQMPNRCRSNCFTFLTDGYTFFRLVGMTYLKLKLDSSNIYCGGVYSV